ncbi:MAG: hypothetical protein IKY92_10135, partial [Akkermansia sp.]|nr:hypothetical protein [Akkermansia sp.]
YSAKTGAYVENSELTVSGDITICAEDHSDTETEGTASCEKTDDALNKENTGVGAGIALGITGNTVEAMLGENAAIMKGFGSLTVTAGSAGTTNVTATAGAAGGTSVAPVVALDVTDIRVKAVVSNNSAALSLSGNMTVKSNSKRKNKASADAAAAGSKVAVGAAISIGVVRVDTIAEANRVVAGAQNVTVSAVSANGAEAIAHAGANGAGAEEAGDEEPEPEQPAAVEPKDENNEEPKDENNEEPKDENKEEPKDEGDATKSINKVLQSGKALAGDKAECPEETPQKPETSEGQVSVGAALGLLIADGATGATLGQSVTATGNLTVQTATEKDMTVVADASATNSDTGVGVAIGILVADSNTEMVIVKGIEIVAGSVTLGSVMGEISEEEEPEEATEGEETETEEDTLGNGTNEITVTTTSGAGASNVGIAGSLAIAVVNMKYEAELPAAVEADGEVMLRAEQKNDIHVFAGAGSAEEGAGGGTGVGASFALLTANLKARAEVTDVEITSDGLTLKASAESEILTQTVTGAKGKAEEEEEEEPAEGEATEPTEPAAEEENSEETLNKTQISVGMTVAVIQSDVIARIGKGAKITTGALALTATGSATSTVQAGAAAEATGLAVGASILVNVANSNTLATLGGEIAAEAVTVQAADSLKQTLAATGGGSGASGAYIAVAVIKQTSAAQVKETSSLEAASLKVASSQEGLTTVESISGSGEAETEEEKKEEKENISVADALEKVGKLEVKDGEGNTQKAVAEKDIQAAEENFNAGAESAQKEGEAAASKDQFVGAFTVVVANHSNTAEITNNTQIQVNGSIEVAANGTARYDSKADGSAVVPLEENETVGTSVGVAVVVQVVSAENVATVADGKITAESLSVTATSGSEAQHSGSIAKAQAGFSAGKFGLGGAIAVNVYSAKTGAYVENSELTVSGDITICAEDHSDTETEGTASCEKTDDALN